MKKLIKLVLLLGAVCVGAHVAYFVISGKKPEVGSCPVVKRVGCQKDCS